MLRMAKRSRNEVVTPTKIYMSIMFDSMAYRCHCNVSQTEHNCSPNYLNSEVRGLWGSFNFFFFFCIRVIQNG
jgi:hypothetical protein